MQTSVFKYRPIMAWTHQIHLRAISYHVFLRECGLLTAAASACSARRSSLSNTRFVIWATALDKETLPLNGSPIANHRRHLCANRRQCSAITALVILKFLQLECRTKWVIRIMRRWLGSVNRCFSAQRKLGSFVNHVRTLPVAV